jgi:transposase
MEVLYSRCCGLDVHRSRVVACMSIIEASQRQKETRTFGTTTRELLILRQWLVEEGCTHIGMESTGVLWRPVADRLTGFFELLLVNAQHMKRVPGRKTDVQDAEWLADLLQHGLLTPSFVPDQSQQDLRDLTRLRVHLLQDRTQLVNRIHKVLQQAGIKLAGVLSNILGASGRAIVQALCAGESDPEQLASLAHKSLAQKHEQLVEALTGDLREHHRFLLRELLTLLDAQERTIRHVELEIENRLRPVEATLSRLEAITGVSRHVLHVLCAEIGVDLSRFPDAAHLASWAGMVRCITRLSIPGAARKNSKGGSWVNGLPRVERQRGQEHATESGRKPEDAYGTVPQDPRNRVRARLPEVQFPIGGCPHPSLQRLRAMSSHGVNSHADTPPFVRRDDGQRVY